MMGLIEQGKFNGRRLYQRRVELGLTMGQVAVLTGRTVGSVHGWERGTYQPTTKSIYQLCQGLQVDPAYFFVSDETDNSGQ